MAVVTALGIGDGLGTPAVMACDLSQQAARVSMRPLEHNFSGNLRGHYRAAVASGASVSVGAGSSGILANFMPPTATSALFVVTRIQVQMEVLTAVTTATPYDFQAFHYSGGTAVSAGTGSTTGTPVKMRASMAASLIQNATTSGEIRAIGTGTGLTAATGKTNDTSPFAAACGQILTNVSATGTAVLVTAGNALPAPIDLYKCDIAAGEHPLVLSGGEGIEIQTITATATSGTVKFLFNFVWAEVTAY